MNWLRLLPLLGLILPLIAGCSAGTDSTFEVPKPPTESSGEPYTRPTADEMKIVLPRDAIPAIFEPTFLTVSEANEFYGDEEPIIGVEIDGEAHAYSTIHLNGHEIVNDEIAGRKIAVTW